MNTKLMTALILGSFVLAGCSSSGNSGSPASERIEELEEQVAELEEQAEQEQTARERAEQQSQTAEQQRQAAERQRQEAEKRAAEAAAIASQADARAAIVGLRGTDAAGTITVIPRHRMTADVTIASPAVSFASRSRSSASGWSVTTLSNAGFTHNDDLVVYSNRGPATRVLLTQQYSGRFTDGEPETANSPIMAAISPTDAHLIRSGSFPTMDGGDKMFPNNYENDATNDGLDIVRFSGTFHGASGYFHCTAQPCTIGRRGNRYTVVAGTWAFHATDAARALVDDASYMYFGWWKRELKSDESLSFQTFAGGMPADHSATTNATAFNALTQTATYRGPAVGQYAIYQPLGAQSSAGSFTASAVLTANFDTEMLSGTITNFSNASDWSVTLNTAPMTGGEVNADGAVDWAIAGNTSGGQGEWTAEFFSEVPYVGQTPDGVVGEFTAVFDIDADASNTNDVGRIAGAFGARK